MLVNIFHLTNSIVKYIIIMFIRIITNRASWNKSSPTLNLIRTNKMLRSRSKQRRNPISKSDSVLLTRSSNILETNRRTHHKSMSFFLVFLKQTCLCTSKVLNIRNNHESGNINTKITLTFTSSTITSQVVNKSSRWQKRIPTRLLQLDER